MPQNMHSLQTTTPPLLGAASRANSVAKPRKARGSSPRPGAQIYAPRANPATFQTTYSLLNVLRLGRKGRASFQPTSFHPVRSQWRGKTAHLAALVSLTVSLLPAIILVAGGCHRGLLTGVAARRKARRTYSGRPRKGFREGEGGAGSVETAIINVGRSRVWAVGVDAYGTKLHHRNWIADACNSNR